VTPSVVYSLLITHDILIKDENNLLKNYNPHVFTHFYNVANKAYLANHAHANSTVLKLTLHVLKI